MKVDANEAPVPTGEGRIVGKGPSGKEIKELEATLEKYGRDSAVGRQITRELSAIEAAHEERTA